MPKKIWNDEEEKYLIINYFDTDMEILMSNLRKTKEQIQSKAKIFKLKRNRTLDNKQKKLKEKNHTFIGGIEYKKCKTCEQYLLLSMFYAHKETFDLLDVRCKECTKLGSKRSVDNNKEKVKDYQQNYQLVNKERLEKYYNNRYIKLPRSYFLNKSKKYRENNREKLKDYQKKYRQTEQGKELHRIHQQNRRSKKKDLKRDLTIEEWNNTLFHWKDKNGDIHCAYCNNITDKPHQEHIIPLANGGEYTKNNIIPSCPECNLSKSNKSLDEYFIYSQNFSEDSYSKIKNFIKKTTLLNKESGSL